MAVMASCTHVPPHAFVSSCHQNTAHPPYKQGLAAVVGGPICPIPILVTPPPDAPAFLPTSSSSCLGDLVLDLVHVRGAMNRLVTLIIA